MVILISGALQLMPIQGKASFFAKCRTTTLQISAIKQHLLISLFVPWTMIRREDSYTQEMRWASWFNGIYPPLSRKSMRWSHRKQQLTRHWPVQVHKAQTFWPHRTQRTLRWERTALSWLPLNKHSKLSLMRVMSSANGDGKPTMIWLTRWHTLKSSIS